MPAFAPDTTCLAVPAPGMTGGLAIGRDEGDGIIRVIGKGSWSPDEIDAHFAVLGRIIGLARASCNPVRVLVDLRRAGSQTPAAAARLTAGIDTAYGHDDRIAIVMATSLDKLQMRRAIHSVEHQMFLSPSAAMTWLCAYDRSPRRA